LDIRERLKEKMVRLKGHKEEGGGENGEEKKVRGKEAKKRKRNKERKERRSKESGEGQGTLKKEREIQKGRKKKKNGTLTPTAIDISRAGEDGRPWRIHKSRLGGNNESGSPIKRSHSL
jgi:hypothetical protein